MYGKCQFDDFWTLLAPTPEIFYTNAGPTPIRSNTMSKQSLEEAVKLYSTSAYNPKMSVLSKYNGTLDNVFKRHREYPLAAEQ
jgi:hypothetical protein